MAEITATGFASKAAIGKESQVGVPVLATQQIPLISESISDEYATLPDVVLNGRGASRQPDRGNQTLGGDITVQMRYALRLLLFEAFFGQEVAGVYTPTLSTEGLGFTLPIAKGLDRIWEFVGVKVSQIAISWATERVQAVFTVIGTGRSLEEDLVNTPETMALLFDCGDNLLFTDMVFRIGERDHVLGAGDEYGISTLTLTLARPLDETFTNQQPAPIEAVGSDFRAITLAFTVPRYNTEVFHNWKRLKTRLHAQIITTRGSNANTFILPQITIDTAGSPITGPPALTIDVSASGNEAEDCLESTEISFAAADNSLNLTSGSAVAATGTLTLTGVVVDGETVTIGNTVFEVDTELGGNVTTGRIRVDLSGGTTVRAQGTLTVDTQPTAGDTMTIGSRTYTFQANGALTNVSGNIEIGSSLAVSKTNIVNAINRTGTPGTGYAAATPVHAQVTIAAFISDDAILTARKGGTAGNALTSTETFTAVTNVFDATTLGTTTAGVDATPAEMVTGLVLAAGATPALTVDLIDGAGTTVVATAKTAGTVGNSIPTTETLTNGSWGTTTLTGGSGTLTRFATTYAGSDVYISGAATPGNNGVAPVVSWTPTKLILAAAAAGGLDLTDGVSGPEIHVNIRSFNVQMIEV